jgi:hypothetical protein
MGRWQTKQTTTGGVTVRGLTVRSLRLQAAGLDADFLDFATRSNRGVQGAPAEYAYEYLLVVGGKKG